MSHHVLITVLDAFCSDMLSESDTPHLWLFSRAWTRVPHARSVFPSETRVCASSLVSGCWPERHGLTANYQFMPEGGPLLNSGLPEDLRLWKKYLAAASPDSAPVPDFGTTLARAGKTLLSVAAASDGCCTLLDRDAKLHGHLRLAVRTPEACSSPEHHEEMVRRFGPVPDVRADDGTYSPELMAYTVSVLLGHLRSDAPDAALCWLPEPDMAGHLFGTRSPQHRRALSVIDAQCGRILDWWENEGRRQGWQIFFMADHGMADAAARHDIPAALREAGFDVSLSHEGQAVSATRNKTTFRLLNAASGHARFDGAPDNEAIEALIEALRPLCAELFLSDKLLDDCPVPDVRPLSLMHCAHPLGPQIRFTLAGTASGPGVPAGTTKTGFHGGLLFREMHPLLLAGGTGIRPAYEASCRSALPDIVPTALALLGVPVPERMQGRVLNEILAEPKEI